MSDKIFWTTGMVVIIGGGFWLLSIAGIKLLEEIIRLTRFGNEYWEYCKWKRMKAKQSRIQKREVQGE